jgi:hypothetical protein
MLSVRLPVDLDAQLNAYCASEQMHKSKVVQLALRNHLSWAYQSTAANDGDPLMALLGSGNGRYKTEEVMQMSRGADWNKP